MYERYATCIPLVWQAIIRIALGLSNSDYVL